ANPLVFLVGAGPGSPGLLTVRGAEVLARADLVLYDQLVPERLLDLAPAHAERICVRDLPGNHPDKYPHIHKKLIETAAAGKVVVRLKGGDPLIFGRGGEEAEALRAAGLPYEIVPGVTAALAAGAYLEIPLTHRMYASSLALITGHELPNKPGNKLDWKAIAAFPGTLAIYMGIARLPVIVAELLKYGKDPHTPAAIVERASLGEQRSVFAALGDLEEARRHAGLEAPGLILIGEAIRHRSGRPWFESRPLFGQRVLVTRPGHQSAGMVRKLEHLGAVVSRLPAVEIRDVADFAAVDRALGRLRDGDWDWLVFTSANGVSALLRRLDALGRDLRDLGRVRLAAVGPKTADALRAFHLRADVVPAA
ncbi:MAG: uroporphyrinogen-III C-methyltransferase, partial [Gemmataceae bacterium]|nr:uroporphyrinogen-III C-methyltransferase [Gemmataceae bacterium]